MLSDGIYFVDPFFPVACLFKAQKRFELVLGFKLFPFSAVNRWNGGQAVFEDLMFGLWVPMFSARGFLLT